MSSADVQARRSVLAKCDGASNPKTKLSGIGIVFFEHDGAADPLPVSRKTSVEIMPPVSRELVDTIKPKSTHPTNNEAEYVSLIVAMEEILAAGEVFSRAGLYMDSKLVVMQVLGKWKINAPHLQKLKDRATELLRELQALGTKVAIGHVRRNFNTDADDESKGYVIGKDPITVGAKTAKRTKQAKRAAGVSPMPVITALPALPKAPAKAPAPERPPTRTPKAGESSKIKDWKVRPSKGPLDRFLSLDQQ